MTTETAPGTGKHAGKYLTVALDQESYGISAVRVREIIRLQKITGVPQLPAFMKGVTNIRGRVIPVVDLRLKFGLNASFTDHTCIVVTEVHAADGVTVPVGLIVDSVEEVVSLTGSEIEPTPEFGARVDTTYLLGLAKVRGHVTALLEIDKVASPEAMRGSQAAQ